MADIAFFVGTLVPTFLVSRLLLWITKAWAGGAVRLVFCNLLALIIAGLVAGMGLADGGAFAGAEALVSYAPAQGVWLLVDLIRHRRRLRPGTP